MATMEEQLLQRLGCGQDTARSLAQIMADKKVGTFDGNGWRLPDRIVVRIDLTTGQMKVDTDEHPEVSHVVESAFAGLLDRHRAEPLESPVHVVEIARVVARIVDPAKVSVYGYKDADGPAFAVEADGWWVFTIVGERGESLDDGRRVRECETVGGLATAVARLLRTPRMSRELAWIQARAAATLVEVPVEGAVPEAGRG